MRMVTGGRRAVAALAHEKKEVKSILALWNTRGDRITMQ